MLISTNILRDQASDFNYITTANAQRIFDQIASSVGRRVSSFNLIGSYGTGKSSFLLALESTITGQTQFLEHEHSFRSTSFIKVIGQPKSLRQSLAEQLDCPADQVNVIKALLNKAKGKDALFLLVDEFGKSLEYAIANNPKEETYFLQVLAEAVNDDNNIVLITTLHQNFDAYNSGASSADALEWEKVSGRFTAINFNEPPETLVKLAISRLAKRSTEKLSPKLDQVIRNTGLLPLSFIENLEKEQSATSPFDQLTAYIIVSLLQKYGQNERSLFTFLNSEGSFSLASKPESEAYLLHDFYDYAIDRLGHIIYSPSNPDKLQWESAERAIQRSDHHQGIDPSISHPLLKTILLLNLFSREKGEFNQAIAANYFKEIFGEAAKATLDELSNKSIIQYLRYKNKMVFVEGTDVNIQSELLEANRKIPAEINVEEELKRLLQLKPILAKRHYLKTGTPRFAEFYFDSKQFDLANDLKDGNAKILVNSRLKLKPESTQSYVMSCELGELEGITGQIKDVLKHEIILEKYEKDFSVKQIIQRELNHALLSFESSFRTLLFQNSSWYGAEGEAIEVHNEGDFNKVLSQGFTSSYHQAPIIKNELVNKSKLSASVNSARRNLIRNLLNRYEDPSLSFSPKKYPADKTIFNSLFASAGLYDYESGAIIPPQKDHSYYPLWQACLDLLDESRQGRKNLSEFLELIQAKPFGLKKGLLRLWLMFFLVAEEENYALYFLPENKFLPYFSDDIYENILKNPDNFAVKRYNYDKLPQTLLEEYRKHSVYLGDLDSESARSTYFKLYGELLGKFKNLPKFTLNTNSRLSQKARDFRAAVLNANDPEQSLTAAVPLALGYQDLAKLSKKDTAAYFEDIRAIENELGACYDKLLDEIYQLIAEAVGVAKDSEIDFVKDYFAKLSEGLDLNLLNQESRILYQRLVSPLDLKNAWTKSVADIINGSSIDKIKDQDLAHLFRNIKLKIDDLITASQMHASGEGLKDRFTIKIVLPNGETLSRTLLKEENSNGQKAKSQKVQQLANQLLEELSK